ncbi:MAG: hypothetical protein LBH07_04330 [Treponema sp.]|nr:hypothetical protein [Treponema sp.]
METFLHILIMILIGLFLLWFGFNLFFFAPKNLSVPAFKRKNRSLKPKGEGIPGAPRICPVCSAKLEMGEKVKSSAFPSSNNGADRLMHISGCIYCLEGGRRRVCPVCGTVLQRIEILIARLFEKPGRSHVHVMGCTCCKIQHRTNN